uniref:Protein kinase domain-containing protein n=1 Tax=Physcomitrium patens TaxID=3218 RepID=A0A2K1KWY7_PHYPA|nr:hypothetical protein PHYPA_005283 [Physcomitrium patens]
MEHLKRHPLWGWFLEKDDWGGKYEVGKKIAEGGQAEIFEGSIMYSNGDCNEMAFKVFKRGFLVQDLQKQWPLAMFKRPVVGTICGPITDIILFDDGRFGFVMWKYWGDLRQLIDLENQEKQNQEPPFQHPLKIMLTFSKNMANLHKDDILHRGLKAANILILRTDREETEYVCRVADYECSVGVLRTTFWRAPEILLATKDRMLAAKNGNSSMPAISFAKAADVYSFGMVCYEVLTGLLPFESEGLLPTQEGYDLVIRGLRPTLPDDVELWMKKLITSCWHQDQSQRPEFHEIIRILKHTESCEF